MEITIGNAKALGAPYRGWFLGHFVAEEGRQSREVEVKWGVHAKGEMNEGLAANRTAKTLSILISGRFRLEFQTGAERREVVLKDAADFALWDAGVLHTWEAEEESVLVTVRWPSVAGDQG